MTEATQGPVDSRAWPDGTYESLDRWRQGHVLDGLPLIALGAADRTALWALSAPTGSAIAGAPVLTHVGPERFRVMVVSQGCDLVKRTFPAATVVPVYE